jgi:potassium-transporting ATPase KdpC subunit
MHQILTAFRILVLCTILTGFLYPGFILGIAQCFFPWQANGSFLTRDAVRVGSYHIGQFFSNPAYFWGRPSATPGQPYNALHSSGSNLGPSDPKRFKAIQEYIALYHSADNGLHMPIPDDLLTASGSGLDPDISPDAARYQIYRVAKARQLPVDTVARLVEQSIIDRSAKILGEPRINVLQLNLSLDQLSRNNHGKTP